MRTKANRTPKVTELELRNAEIARSAAIEGVVLLKNDGVLPLEPCAIALYGEGVVDTIKGGVGSGEVNCRHTVSIMEGLESAGYTILTHSWLDEYTAARDDARQEYLRAMRRRAGLINFTALPYLLSHPFRSPSYKPVGDSDVAAQTDVCFFIISRQAGEDIDRSPEKGDFCLSDEELASLRVCSQHYNKTILVINAGGYIDLSPVDELHISAIIFFCQQGSEGGHAFADVVSGKVSPSGHLSASWPKCYHDVPFGGEFSHLKGDLPKNEYYREGIYVGYRYYDTFDVTPRYEFGYGLSYTEFALCSTVSADGGSITVGAVVRNTGAHPGRAVVQTYLSCPVGRLDKERQRLVGFAKTGVIEPGAEQRVEIHFTADDMASFDAASSRTILEPGDYIVRVGQSSRQTCPVACLRLAGEVVLREHDPICPPREVFDELRCRRASQTTPDDLPVIELNVVGAPVQTEAANQPSTEVAALLGKLTTKQKIRLCSGAGIDIALPGRHWLNVPGAGGYTASRLERRGIPEIAMCDGPAGLRLYDVSVRHGGTVRMTTPVISFFDILPSIVRNIIIRKPRRGKTLYQYATAFPVGMSLAQSWNVETVRQVGCAIQSEMEAFGAVCWLGPGMNIYRSPLCGRNYEYFSEDPVLSGSIAAAIVGGVQSKAGYIATIKHFCCNNQEVNRKYISENLSARALREIYLRNFEIAVTRSRPRALMTSYNRINGVYSSESRDLLTTVLREEWGFGGLLMTDWFVESDIADAGRALGAGVDVYMPGGALHRRRIARALRRGEITLTGVERAAARVLTAVVGSDTYRQFISEKKRGDSND